MQTSLTFDGALTVDIAEPRMAGTLEVRFARNESGLRMVTFGGNVFTTHRKDIDHHPNVVTVNGVACQVAGLAVVEQTPGSWRYVGSRCARRVGTGSTDYPTENIRIKLRDWGEKTAGRLAETHLDQFDESVIVAQLQVSERLRAFDEKIETFQQRLRARLELTVDVTTGRATISPAVAEPLRCRWHSTDIGRYNGLDAGVACARITSTEGWTIGWMVREGRDRRGQNPGRPGELLIPLDQIEFDE